MSNWFKAHMVKARSRGDREEVNLQVFDRNGMALDLSTGGSGGGGEATSFPMPLAVFDFSDRSSVVRESLMQGSIYPQPYGGRDLGFDVLNSENLTDWSTNYQSDALGHRNALVISPGEEEYIFVGDSDIPIDSPVRFIVAKLEEVVAQRALTGVNAGDYSHLITWDDEGTVRWGCLFYFDDVFHFRTTDAQVDTDLHVYCTGHAADAAGIHIDGVLWPWTNSPPIGWADRLVVYENFDTFIGAGASDYPSTTGSFVIPLRLGELRIYRSDAYPFIAELSSLLKRKWQGFVVPSVEPLGVGAGEVAFAVVPESPPQQNQLLGWNNGEWGSVPRDRSVANSTTPLFSLDPNAEFAIVFTAQNSTTHIVELRVEVVEGSVDSFEMSRHLRDSSGVEIDPGIELSDLKRIDGTDGVDGPTMSTCMVMPFLYNGDALRAHFVAGSDGGSFRIRFFAVELHS